jgi:hypothetical protein
MDQQELKQYHLATYLQSLPVDSVNDLLDQLLMGLVVKFPVREVSWCQV